MVVLQESREGQMINMNLLTVFTLELFEDEPVKKKYKVLLLKTAHRPPKEECSTRITILCIFTLSDQKKGFLSSPYRSLCFTH